MNIRIAVLRVTCTAALTLSATAQQPVAKAMLSPIPAYPVDGQIPDELRNHFVFLDFARNQIVVSYADVSAVGGRRVLRFDRPSNGEPSIKSSVSLVADGAYTYKYSLQNGTGAGASLKSFSIVVAKDDTNLNSRHPLWNRDSARPEIARAGAVRPEALMTWNSPASAVLATGATLPGFEIVSDFRPGLTIALTESAGEKVLTSEIAATLPEAVQDQLSIILKPELNAAQVMTVGPRFAPGDPKSIIAMDFHSGLNKLAILGPLEPTSPFVSGALQALVSYMAASDSNILSLEFLEKAAPGLEMEIAAAMRISLR